MKIGDVFGLEQYTQYVLWAKDNNARIVELEPKEEEKIIQEHCMAEKKVIVKAAVCDVEGKIIEPEECEWLPEEKTQDVVIRVLSRRYMVADAADEKVFSADDVRDIRAELYLKQVDPLTTQISRLRDEKQTEIVAAAIRSLQKQRAWNVAVIRADNPYPESGVADA